MKRAVPVRYALIESGAVGGIYGAVYGAAYMVLFNVGGAIHSQDPSALTFAFALLGSVFGFPAGFLSGVLGACLGGPIGCSLGGLVGTVTVMEVVFGRIDALSAEFVIYPGLWAAVFGFILGQQIRRGVPLFPGVEWLAERIYGSPLGGWLGWRQGHVR
jgi:hypothetical protein